MPDKMVLPPPETVSPLLPKMPPATVRVPVGLLLVKVPLPARVTFELNNWLLLSAAVNVIEPPELRVSVWAPTPLFPMVYPPALVSKTTEPTVTPLPRSMGPLPAMLNRAVVPDPGTVDGDQLDAVDQVLLDAPVQVYVWAWTGRAPPIQARAAERQAATRHRLPRVKKRETLEFAVSRMENNIVKDL
jgi:hypothetical protein